MTRSAVTSSKTLVYSIYYPYINGYASLGEIFTSIPPITILIVLSTLILNFAVVILLAVTGLALWRLRKWARTAAIICSIFLGSINLMMVIAKSFWGNFGIPYILLLQILVLWILFREDIKVIFDNTNQEGVGVTV